MIFRRFVEHARTKPDALFAVIYKGGRQQAFSRRDTLNTAIAVLQSLQRIGRTPGSVVPIILEHSPLLYPSFIGCVLGGFVPAFLPPWNPRQDPAIFKAGMGVLFDRLSAGCVITSRESAGSIPENRNLQTLWVEE